MTTHTAPPTAPPASASLLTELNLGKDRFLDVVDLAQQLKDARRQQRERPMLRSRNIALVFQKASTRTRCAFEVAAADQGAHTTYLGPDGTHLGHEESIADTARVLGHLYDGIAFRGFAQETIEEMARHAGVPVWNALSDDWHPTQMLADVLTIREAFPDRRRVSWAYLGDGRNNVARSILVTGAMLGMDVRIGSPLALQPPRTVQTLAAELAQSSGGGAWVTDDPVGSVAGADVVYTDTWVSMGEPDSAWDERVPMLRPYRVTCDLMAMTGKPDSRFMHCLPATHDDRTDLGRRVLDRYGLFGAEVSDDVFNADTSLVFQQAANRMHTIKAVLVSSLT
ncbi:ornithine carbamoyltransferase [Nocardioides sp. YIM 152315]|uniref:ornithine carbamoyltransferase n=1 Tax=Nocardioides sp. YIM 152315 TaxID=3031760 RepID=UPI0023D99D0B|nr:ornithine carbamoyltransferase [Nocardioides sp. YIM 152315]MDF1602037.1 ornithine carbamoyltransferase [Nocardioides sp. YIM 152315]